jgi:hypothetical protein
MTQQAGTPLVLLQQLIQGQLTRIQSGNELLKLGQRRFVTERQRWLRACCGGDAGFGHGM